MFPRDPRMVRYRKLRLLLWTITASVLALVVVGLIFYVASRPGHGM